MKSILIIVPYDHVYPPMNGGMQRCFHIINQLATYFDLSLIIFQDKNTFMSAKETYPAIANIKIYSTKDVVPVKDIFSLLPRKFENALRYRWIKKQLNGSADGMFLEYYPVLKSLLKQYKFDGIILENLSSLHAVSIIRKYDPEVKIVYDAHNVDSNLAVSGKEELYITKTESTLHQNINALFTCSANDRLDFERMNNEPLLAEVIANGVNITGRFDEGVRKENPEFILFCGLLGSAPNIEGLFWLYHNIWNIVLKSLPQLKLLVVGSGQLPVEAQFLLDDPTLVFSGAVDDVKPWYNKAALSIVPLRSGSGTRLKILEAMSLGLPVISTSKGAEGINYTNGQNIIIADEPDCFAESIINLLENSDQRKTLANQARKLVEEEYDWNRIGETMQRFLHNNVLKHGE